MSDLDAQIEKWRRQMADGGVHAVEVMEELESHLREDIEAQQSAGVGEQEAFAASVARLGGAEVLKKEFDKVGGMNRVKSVFLTLAGIPSSHQSNIMNMTTTSSTIEPRWATYTKVAVFVSPAVFLWAFSVIFLVPKLKHICQISGVKLHWLYQFTMFFADHALLTLVALALPFLLLEWRWARWPQFRRVSLGSVVFLLNTVILALITLMVVAFAMLAPAIVNKG
jgi:hypothetical protein